MGVFPRSSFNRDSQTHIIRINYSLKKSEYESSVTLLKEESGNYQEMISKIAPIEDQIKGNNEKANEIRSSMSRYI